MKLGSETTWTTACCHNQMATEPYKTRMTEENTAEFPLKSKGEYYSPNAPIQVLPPIVTFRGLKPCGLDLHLMSYDLGQFYASPYRCCCLVALDHKVNERIYA